MVSCLLRGSSKMGRSQAEPAFPKECVLEHSSSEKLYVELTVRLDLRGCGIVINI